MTAKAKQRDYNRLRVTFFLANRVLFHRLLRIESLCLCHTLSLFLSQKAPIAFVLSSVILLSLHMLEYYKFLTKGYQRNGGLSAPAPSSWSGRYGIPFPVLKTMIPTHVRIKLSFYFLISHSPCGTSLCVTRFTFKEHNFRVQIIKWTSLIFVCQRTFPLFFGNSTLVFPVSTNSPPLSLDVVWVRLAH